MTNSIAKTLLLTAFLGLLLVLDMTETAAQTPDNRSDPEQRIESLLVQMTLAEKIGQMNQMSMRASTSYGHD